jgi:ubiquinone/menaquinone biosynthesis C-methylase UbiE
MNLHKIELENSPPTPSANETDVIAYFKSAALNWDTIYRREDVWGVIHQERLARFLAFVEELRLPSGMRVLDAGCGAGFASVALAERGYVVEAIDAVGSMIDLTRQNVLRAGVGDRVSANTGDIYRLCFPDEAFRLVLSIGVIPWLKSPAAAIAEVSRVLQSGGYLLFTADNRWRLSLWLDPLKSPALEPARRAVKKLLGYSNQPGSEDQACSHLHSIQEVDVFLAGVGLERVHSETLGFGPFTMFYRTFVPERVGIWIHRLLQRLANRRFPLLASTGAQFLVIAKKQERD